MHKSLRICLISDTHGLHREIDLPAADLLVHAGDASMMGNFDHFRDFDRWLGEAGIPAVFVPGNHDSPATEDPGLIRNATVLLGRGIRINGLHVWGVPWCWGGAQRQSEFDAIPKEVDVLVTHVPAYGILDCHEGDPLLRSTLARVRPRIHVCGHIHAGRGMIEIGDTTCVNASMLRPDGDLCTNPYVFRISAD